MDSFAIRDVVYGLCRGQSDFSSVNQHQQEAMLAFTNDQLDFSKITFTTYEKNKRYLASIERFSPENIFITYLSKKIGASLVYHPESRNEIIFSLSNTLSILPNSDDFTIFRFDFRKFFYSISPSYVFQKYGNDFSLNEEDKKLLSSYCASVARCWPGLALSNVLAELIASHFDIIAKKEFYRYGVLFYGRFVDDGIVILKSHVEETDCLKIVSSAIAEIFYDQKITGGKKINTTKIHDKQGKLAYLTYRDFYRTVSPLASFSFTYLGYEFQIVKNNNKLGPIQIGIDQRKWGKYISRLAFVMKKYQSNEKALALALQLSCSRIVFQKKNSSGKKLNWMVKGLSSVYPQLGYEMCRLIPKTSKFLQDAVLNAHLQSRVPIPTFICGALNNNQCYTFYYSYRNDKTFVFDETIGISLSKLISYADILGIQYSKTDGYYQILRRMLYEIGMGF